MDRIERFNKRKDIVKNINHKSIKMPNKEDDLKFVEQMIHKEHQFDFTVTSEEAKEFLEKFKKDFNDERFNKLIADCKSDVIRSIVTPFGLGKVLSAYDKTGGNVDTIHNVRNKNKTGIGMSNDESKRDGLGIYSTKEAQNDYENRSEYNAEDYHDNNENYINTREKFSKQQKDGVLINGYNGEIIPRYDESDPTKQFGTEHIISAKEISDDSAVILANQEGTELANNDSNLTATTKSVNSSKGESSMDEFIQRAEKNKRKIEKLESKKELSASEQKKLKKLKRVTQIDKDKMKQLDEKARQAYNKKLNEYYKSAKFLKNTAITGAKEGAKMGTQQAIGLVMTEFFTAVFDEILDIYKEGFSHGFDDDKFFTILKKRIKRIGERVLDRWKDAITAFQDGFISGFISNLATTAINMFITTGKRVVRIIREGMFSLFRAVKLLLYPPEDMTFEEAMHEAKKLIATGLVVSLGVIIEEWVDTLIKGTALLEPLSDILTTIFIGTITGLAITMVVYYIDKKKNEKDVVKLLTNDTNKKFDNIEKLLTYLSLNTPHMQVSKA